MKLYTEKEIRKRLNSPMDGEVTIDEFIESLSHIELPSDEEIKKQMKFDWLDPEDVAYLGGAIWMRNKIQGGNNEQQ